MRLKQFPSGFAAEGDCLHVGAIAAQRQFHVLSLLRSLHVLADCDFKLC